MPGRTARPQADAPRPAPAADPVAGLLEGFTIETDADRRLVEWLKKMFPATHAKAVRDADPAKPNTEAE